MIKNTFIALLLALSLLSASSVQAQTYTQNWDSISNGTAVSAITGWVNEIGTTMQVENTASNSTPNGVYSTNNGDAVVYEGLGQFPTQTIKAAVLFGTNSHVRFHLRSDGTGQNYYELIVEAISPYYIVRKTVAGTASGNYTLTGSSATTPAVSTWYWVKANISGTNPTTIQFKVWPIASTEPTNYEVATTDSSSPFTTGYPGIRDVTGIYNGQTTEGVFDDVTITEGTSGLTAGSASLVGSGNGTASVAVAAASGGTSPYTYQWYRSTTNGFTPGSGNLISGATGLTYSDSGLTNGTTYYYVNVATDSASNVANSNQVSATPTASTLAVGSVSTVSVGNGTASVAVTAATGGTSPYTYQWYRSTTSGFTPGSGNMVSGATSLTLNDTGLTNGTTYYYVNKVTDSASNSAISSQTSATPTAGCTPVVAGNSSVTSMGNTIATVAGTGASGGCSTITYQWYRATTPGFSPGSGNAVSGATSLILSDTGLTNNTPYYYVLGATDGTTTAYYYQVAVVPAPTVYLGLIGDSYLTTYCPTAGGTVLVSNTSTSAGALVGAKLQAMFKDGTQVVWNNQGIGGTNGYNWAPGGGDLTGALSAFNATHSIHSDWTIEVHLGGNDASVSYSNPAGGESQAQYQAYMQAIADYLIGTWGAKDVIFMGPPYIKAMSSNRTAFGTSLLASYYAALKNVATTHPGHVFAPQEEYRWAMANQQDIGTCDYVHPFQVDSTGLGGTGDLAAMWARSIYTILNPNQLWTHY